MKEPRKQQTLWSAIGRCLWLALCAVYRYHYDLGSFVIRNGRIVGSFVARITRRPRRLLRYTWRSWISRPIHRFFRRIGWLCAGLPRSYRGMGAALRKNPLSLLVQLPRGFLRWLVDYREGWFSIGRLVGPIVAGWLLFVTLNGVAGTEYCLVLTYRGNELGVIDSSAVYDEGASLARDRVTNEDDSFTVDEVPTLTMVVKGAKAPMSASQVCDAILRNSSDAIAEATGLYIDGDFIGAMEDSDKLQAMLDDLKEGHYDKKDPDQRAEFVQDVKTEDGLFPISTITKKTDLKKKLTHQTVVEKIYVVQAGDVFGRIAMKHDMTSAELRALNPQIENTDQLQIGDELVVQRPQSFLQVKVVKTIRYTEVIDYKTQTIYRDDKDEGYSNTTTYGQEGSRDVVAEITYLDGLETDRSVVSTKVTKQPVTKVVEVGTRRIAPMLWPVPVCHNVYQGYHGGHLAIDISSGPVPVLGHPAVSADSGVVIEAATGWNGGYGNVVKVRHNNGLVTVYAHLQTVKVYSGQRVSRGQTVGLIGNTGYSFGPHLHFEVIRNGSKVNPLNYVKP